MEPVQSLGMRSLLTFIMAGGKGERLSPLTRDRAKPAVPFGGVYRIIDFTLSNCINSGIRKIHVLTQYKSYSLQRHLLMGWNIFDSELGEYIDIIPAQQRMGEHWYKGTADAIYQNMNVVEHEHPEHLLILAGDHVYKMNYAEMYQFHLDQGADATVGVIEMPVAKTTQFGVLEVDRGQQIVGFEEKPKKPKTIPGDAQRCYVSMGIYLFKREALERVLAEDAPRGDSTHDFGRDVIPAMVRSELRVCAYNFKDENKHEAKYWRDIGTLDAYYEANMDLVQVSPVFNMYDQDWPIRTYHEQYPPAKTVFAQEETDRVGLALDSLISPGVIISGGRVERSVLSPGVRINSYSQVEDAVLMERVNVGRYAKIRRAIIDKDVQIPPRMEIGYDLERDRKRFTVTESGIVVVAKGTTILEDAPAAAVPA